MFKFRIVRLYAQKAAGIVAQRITKETSRQFKPLLCELLASGGSLGEGALNV